MAGLRRASSADRLDVAVRGLDGSAWVREFTAAAGLGFVSMGGRVLANTDPAIVNTGGTLYVLVVGTDNAMWANHTTDGSRWSGWASLHGNVSGPAAASPAAGTAVAFARGVDSVAWFKEFAGTTTGVRAGWQPLAGELTSGLGATSAQDGTTGVVALATDNHIWMRTGVWPSLGSWTNVL